jgi:glucose-1-phosphate adenylyltransferase
VLAAEQTQYSETWYQGTADAVRKQLLEIQATGADYVLILAGDHLYRMDYAALAAFHWANDADITVAVQPVLRSEAHRYGLLKRSPDCRIVDFVEKPKDPALLEQFVSRDDPQRPFLGSMGIYLFKTGILLDLLTSTVADDFGGEVIPSAIDKRRVFGYDFKGFWEDIGTIRSFYETNMMLTKPDSPFNFHDPERPIYTRPRYLPGAIISGATLHNVFLADGCRIHRAEIRDSIIGLRSYIADGARITDSIIMGADFYEAGEGEQAASERSDGIRLGIGEDCEIQGAILDKNVRLGSGVVIYPFPRGTEIDGEDWVVRDGIVVIPKGKVLPGGTYIGPEQPTSPD